MLRALLVEMMPLSEPAKAGAPVLAAFLARAVAEPGLAGRRHEESVLLREFVAGLLPATQGDPLLETVGLLALVGGLMSQLLVGHTDAETALATLDYHLDRIFGSARAARRTKSARAT